MRKLFGQLSQVIKWKQVFSVLIAGFLFFNLSTGVASASTDDETLGGRVRERLEETSENSDRPKTTEEFQREARQGVPLGERIRNITRDSAESLQQFGQAYTEGAKESASNVKEAVKDLDDHIPGSVR